MGFKFNSQAVIKSWSNPVTRARRIKAYKRSWKDPRSRARRLRALKVAMKRPSVRRKLRENANHEALSKAARRISRDPKVIAARLQVLRRGGRVKCSKPQVTLFKRLCRAGIKGLKLDFQVTRYLIDIAHLPTRTAIESDGRYFHQDRAKRRRRDRFLKRHGWKMIHVRLDDRKEAREFDISPLVQRLLKGE